HGGGAFISFPGRVPTAWRRCHDPCHRYRSKVPSRLAAGSQSTFDSAQPFALGTTRGARAGRGRRNPDSGRALRGTDPVTEAFFFGPSNQQLFANYHLPAGGNGRVLAVICPPLFSDYTRTQLALRTLAISLAASGQHVLRLDYRGTGDSFGDLGEVAISDWVEDIAFAVQEG